MSQQLRAYAYVEAPFDLAARLLADDAAGVLQDATDDTAEQAGALSRSMKVEIGGFEVSRTVEIEVGTFEPREVTRSVVPLSWRAQHNGLLFPELRGELEVAAVTVDPPLTQITLDGTYEPPLGAIGAGIDRLLLGRLAEAAVHTFVHETAAIIRRRVEAIPPDERV